MSKLAPSILSADFSKLGEQVTAISNGGADYVHIDVMDGHFVPNISFGASVMKSLDKLDTPPYDVHLMVERPDDFIEDFVTDKTEYIVVHQEACKHLHRTIEHIKSFDVKAGVSINPATPVNVLEAIISDVDLVLVMSVNPGFGGQKLISSTLNKVNLIKAMREKLNLNFKIEIDGGVNLENYKHISDIGVDIIVAGSAVFNSDNIEERVKTLKSL